MLSELLIFFREDRLEFWSKDSNNRLIEIKVGDSNIIPLYFLLIKDELSIGEYAKEQFERNITGAYGDYWNNALVEDLKIDRFNARYPFKEILFFCIKEVILKEIIRNYFENQPFDKFLKCGKILLLFDSFLNEEIRSMVLKGFIETIGFDTGRILNIEYWDAFSEVQIDKTNLKKEEGFIEISEAFCDLFFNLISKSPSTLLNRKILKGRGNDPLLDTILDYISEKALVRGSMLSIDEAKKELFKDGVIILSKLKDGLIQHKLRLSDISQFTLSFHSDAVLTKLNNKSSLNFVQNEFDNFRNQNKIQKFKIFLNGKTLNSPSFRDFFKSTYSNVFIQNENFDKELVLSVLIKSYFKKYYAPTFPDFNEKHVSSPKIPTLPPPPPAKKLIAPPPPPPAAKKLIVPPPPPPPSKKQVAPPPPPPTPPSVKHEVVPPPPPPPKKTQVVPPPQVKQKEVHPSQKKTGDGRTSAF